MVFTLRRGDARHEGDRRVVLRDGRPKGLSGLAGAPAGAGEVQSRKQHTGDARPAPANTGTCVMVDIRKITDDYSVAPQLTPADVPGIAAAGFRLVICNRPDAESAPSEGTAVMRAAVEEAGLTWAENSFSSNMLTLGNVEAQRELADGAEGPVLAYCRSGTRSATVWALAQAGRMPTDEILAATGQAGYPMDRLKPTIEALADQQQG